MGLPSFIMPHPGWCYQSAATLINFIIYDYINNIGKAVISTHSNIVQRDSVYDCCSSYTEYNYIWISGTVLCSRLDRNMSSLAKSVVLSSRIL